MDTQQKRNVRNSDLIVHKEKRSFLTYPAMGLVSCVLEENEDSITFVFEAKGQESSETILSKPTWEQLRYLYNCASLASLDAEYDFSLSLDNQMLDINLMPSILVRDAKIASAQTSNSQSTTNNSFLQRYKALAGSILLPKYKYEDYINGGQDLYKKNNLLKEISELETLEEIQALLHKEYRRQMWEISTTQKLTPKRNIWAARIAIPILAMALLVSIAIGSRALLIEIPLQNSIITANTAYINGDHLTVQRTLRPYSLDRLPVETRYFLSRSYVSTEALTIIQRENILLGLTPVTNHMLFDYWILLGRLYFDEAVEIARRLGDDEILLFAYHKQAAFVRNDLTMPGEERMQLIAQLEQNIDALQRVRDEARDAFGASP